MRTSNSMYELGWDASFEEAFAEYADSGFMPARVVAQHRGVYLVRSAGIESEARMSGRLRHEADTSGAVPAVGDWVAIASGMGTSVIHAVLPRRTAFSRKVAGVTTDEQVVAANVDVVFVVGALNQELNLRRMERYLTMAWDSGADPVVVLTKSDLCDDVEEMVAAVQGVATGVAVQPVSNVTGWGLDDLRGYLQEGKTVALLGSSGVGKSSLINSLIGGDVQATRAVRTDGKGRHTTTHRELVTVPSGGLMMDTPGMRELQLWSTDEGLDDAFGDVAGLARGCRFNDCSHDSEPGCAVRDAVRKGMLPAERLESFRKLQRELHHLRLKQDARAMADERRKRRTFARSRRRTIY